jgi:hypothetical protein
VARLAPKPDPIPGVAEWVETIVEWTDEDEQDEVEDILERQCSGTASELDEARLEELHATARRRRLAGLRPQ